VRVFKDKRFSHFARREKISDAELRSIVAQVDAGNAEADLGGGVYKVRVPREGEGKSGGYRVVLLFKKDTVTFFKCGFAKSSLGNIKSSQVLHYRKLAKYYFPMNNDQLDDLVKHRLYDEIGGNDDKV
jgi:hypothetical protein